MTPKEKAEDLFYKMQLDWGCNECHNHWAKECALIAVDEILNCTKNGLGITKFSKEYWQEVKTEIENYEQ